MQNANWRETFFSIPQWRCIFSIKRAKDIIDNIVSFLILLIIHVNVAILLCWWNCTIFGFDDFLVTFFVLFFYVWWFIILEIKFYKWKYITSMSYELTISIIKIWHSISDLRFLIWPYDCLIWKLTFCKSYLVEISSLILRWSRKLVYRTKFVKILMKVTTYIDLKKLFGRSQ